MAQWPFAAYMCMAYKKINLNNYCTSSGHVCWNLEINFVYKFDQTRVMSWKLKGYWIYRRRDNIVDYNVTHTMATVNLFKNTP